MGGATAVEAIETVEAIAECKGPRGPYRTLVKTARDGRIVFQQDFPNGRRYRAVLSADGGTEYDSDSAKVTTSTPLSHTAAAGHQIHMLSLAPTTQLGPPTGVTLTRFQDRPVIGVIFHDRTGGTVVANYDRRDTTLRGFTFPGPDGQRIALVVWRWRRFNDVSLPTRAVYWQGQDAYRFHFTHIRLNAVPDSAFTIAADAR